MCAIISPMKLDKTQFLILYHAREVERPTNTGKLIQLLFPGNTHSFVWSRTDPQLELLSLLENHECSPIVLFPEIEHHYDAPPHEQLGTQLALEHINPSGSYLFVLLDGRYSEAKRMLNRSTYLLKLDRLSLPPRTDEDPALQERYMLRKASDPSKLATVVAAAAALHLVGDHAAGSALSSLFSHFQSIYHLDRLNIVAPLATTSFLSASSSSSSLPHSPFDS